MQAASVTTDFGIDSDNSSIGVFLAGCIGGMEAFGW
jgi:hypothetical protein